jgi:hypothetical protein
MVLFDDDEDNILNQFFEDDDESDDDALISTLIAHDEEEERRKNRRRGSVHGREVVYRDRHGGNLRIVPERHPINCARTAGCSNSRCVQSPCLDCEVKGCIAIM